MLMKVRGAPELPKNFSTMSRPFHVEGMVQDPELNNRNRRDHDPNREVNFIAIVSP